LFLDAGAGFGYGVRRVPLERFLQGWPMFSNALTGLAQSKWRKPSTP